MKKLFLSDLFFLSITLVGALGTIFYSTVRGLFSIDRLEYWYVLVMYSICLIILYISYIKHSKNIMKGIIGALLMGLVIESVYSLSADISYLDTMCSMVYFILTVLMFINHFAVNVRHKSNPYRTKLYMRLWSLLSITVIIRNACMIPKCNSNLETAAFLVSFIAYPCIFATISCLEYRLDTFKKNREASGWSEENGYPEGYAHK